MTIDRVSLVSALARSATLLFRLLSLMGIGLCLFFWLTLLHRCQPNFDRGAGDVIPPGAILLFDIVIVNVEKEDAAKEEKERRNKEEDARIAEQKAREEEEERRRAEKEAEEVRRAQEQKAREEEELRRQEELLRREKEEW